MPRARSISGSCVATSVLKNYPIPASTDLSKYHSAVIYCQMFNVVFGTAELRSR